MNWDLLLRLIATAYMLGSGALNVWLFVRSRDDKRFEQIEDNHLSLHEQMQLAIADRKAGHNDHETRLQLIERHIATIPTHDDLRKVYDALALLVSKVERQDERSAHISDAVRRIENHLLDH